MGAYTFIWWVSVRFGSRLQLIADPGCSPTLIVHHASPLRNNIKKVDRFLLFGRNLLEQSSGEALGGYDSDTFDWRSGANNSLTPNESDEVALEFLHKHAGDLRRAQFHLTTQVSGGAGERHRAIFAVQQYCCNTAVRVEFRSRLFQAWVCGA